MPATRFTFRAGLICGLCLAGTWAMAQDDARPKAKADQPKARTGGRPAFAPITSPEVLADRRVTFRLRAPGAKEVSVSGEWPGGTKPMKSDEQGVWSVTLGPLEPEIYGYSFSVDGFQTLDPGNPAVKPMRSPRTSILEIPGDPPRIHEFLEVPHGSVRLHDYRSRSLGRRRGLYVYTPPGYDQDSGTRYPVLYLLHGAGDNQGTWTAAGRAHWILDNLLAQGKVKPMIVVMPDGHATLFTRPPASAPGQPAGSGLRLGRPANRRGCRGTWRSLSATCSKTSSRSWRQTIGCEASPRGERSRASRWVEVNRCRSG